MRHYVLFALFLALCPLPAAAQSAIFFHPDGMGVNTWQALRYRTVGAQKPLHWDSLQHMGVYIGTMADSAAATSNGAATTHAYGVKVPKSSYGMNNGKPIRAASGFEGSIIHEAMANGLKTALINSGSIIEPGTGAFAARVEKRSDYDAIAKQVIESGVDVILSGGEKHLLPAGALGRHGKGTREDGLNLIAQAQKKGYHVVYTAAELRDAVKAKPKKLLGVFAEEHTFFDEDEDKPAYAKSAPDIAAMLDAALTLFTGQRFLIIAEEEGTDNFANKGRPEATIEAAVRADAAIGTMLKAARADPELLLLLASDSDAGGLQLQADKSATSLKTAGTSDFAGGILARSNRPLPAVVDNTQIYSTLAQHLKMTKAAVSKAN
jgi:alkaline phosphatase